MSYIKKSAKLTSEIAQWVCENGLIDYGGASIEMLARQFGISRKTHKAWMQNDSDYADAINEAKRIFAETLEKDLVVSLAKSARGYVSTTRKTEYISDKNGQPIIHKQVVNEVEVPPNTGAAIFLLTNLNPLQWQNKLQQSNDIKGSLTLGVEVQQGLPEIATNEHEIND